MKERQSLLWLSVRPLRKAQTLLTNYTICIHVQKRLAHCHVHVGTASVRMRSMSSLELNVANRDRRSECASVVVERDYIVVQYIIEEEFAIVRSKFKSK